MVASMAEPKAIAVSKTRAGGKADARTINSRAR
jgi:hypothetical protein